MRINGDSSLAFIPILLAVYLCTYVNKNLFDHDEQTVPII